VNLSDLPAASQPVAGGVCCAEHAVSLGGDDKQEEPGKIVKLGKNVELEILAGDKRRVRVHAYVCKRKGDDLQLEQLLCLRESKEHEAILAVDGDARVIHAALIAAKAKPGSPVKYNPKYQAAHGTTIKVLLQYKNKDGKTVTEPAQKWVQHFQTKKDLHYEWVFAGSYFIQGQAEAYAANSGDVICVSNFQEAMLDLPVESSKDNANLLWQANMSRVPAENTPVVVILEPVFKKDEK
jgi:hypothetical protein